MQIYERNRQTDHVEVATLNRANKFRSEPLNRVCPGLVSRLPASSVLLNVVLRKLDKRNLGTGEIKDAPRAGENADPRVDPVIAAGEAAQHPSSIIIAGRFAENVFVQTDYGIGTEDDVLWGGDDGSSLVLGNSPNELSWAFAWVANLRNGTGPDDVVNAGG